MNLESWILNLTLETPLNNEHCASLLDKQALLWNIYISIHTFGLSAWPVEGLESSRLTPSESLKATKSRPHQVRISNSQRTSQSVGRFSKSVLDIRTRLVVTVKPERKWMPNSDSALKLVPKCKILCQYDLLNYFYSCLKIAVF